MRGAGRWHGQIGNALTPLEVPVVEPPRCAAVEGDRLDAGIGVEQLVQGVRNLALDLGVETGAALGHGADIPKRDPPRHDESEPLLINRRPALRRTARG